MTATPSWFDTAGTFHRAYAMKYLDGRDAQLGDHVDLGSGWTGVVVADLDSCHFSEEYPQAVWAHLGKGILVDSPDAGLMHFERAEVDLVLVRRAPHPRSD